MAVDMFLKLDGIKGESKDSKHAGEIEILGWGWAVNQQTIVGAGGGAGAGKVQISDLKMSKKVDAASPNLIASCCGGKHFKTATLTVRKAGGSQQDYLKLNLEEVFITAVEPEGVSADVPTESLSLNFGKFKYAYSPQKPDGSLDAAIEAGWDVKKNEKV
ncbi:MAG: Hcp family type VI secretion system effector [Solimonas sp.]